MAIKTTLQFLKRPLYRNSLLLITNTLLTAGLGFFFWMVVARFYSQVSVGWAAAIISAASILALVSRFGFGLTIIRFLPSSDDPVGIINSCLVLSGAAAITLTLVYVFLLDFWPPALSFVRQNTLFSIAFSIFTIVWTLSTVVDSVYIAKRRVDFILLRNAIFLVVRIPLVVLLVSFFRAFGIVASWGIAVTVAFFISLFVFLPKAQSRYKPLPEIKMGIISSIWRYSLGNYAAALFASSPALVLPIIVVNLQGAEQNAYFYVTWMMASLLFTIPLAISHILFAEGSHFETQLWINVRQALTFMFLLLIPAATLTFLLGKWLLLLFGGDYSTNGLLLLRILTISSVFVGVNNIYTSILRIENRIKELVFFLGFQATATILGGYFALTTIGIAGIGYIWLAAQVIRSIYSLLIIRQRYCER